MRAIGSLVQPWIDRVPRQWEDVVWPAASIDGLFALDYTYGL